MPIFEVKKLEKCVSTVLIEANSPDEAKQIAHSSDHVEWGKDEVISAHLNAHKIDKRPRGKIVHTSKDYYTCS